MILTVRKECSEVLERHPSGKPKVTKHWTEKVKRNCLTLKKVANSGCCYEACASDGGDYGLYKNENPGIKLTVLEKGEIVYL